MMTNGNRDICEVIFVNDVKGFEEMKFKIIVFAVDGM